MAEARPRVPPATKLALVDGAGGKCANPGCANRLIQLHHIKVWAATKRHDAADMIALCSACHDAAHRGELQVDDETLYAWKRISRPTVVTHDHLYVEPSEDEPRMLLGSIAVQGTEGVVAFNLGRSNLLSYRLVDGEVVLLNLQISTTRGRELLRVVDGYVRYQDESGIAYARGPAGHIRVTAPVSDDLLPGWALDRLRVDEPNYASDGSLPLLDLEALAPGVVRVQGVWTRGNDAAVVITRQRLMFLRPPTWGLALVGSGLDSVLSYTGPVGDALFDLSGETQNDTGALLVSPKGSVRVGRNDPCPCGSGRKFKRCHGVLPPK